MDWSQLLVSAETWQIAVAAAGLALLVGLVLGALLRGRGARGVADELAGLAQALEQSEQAVREEIARSRGEQSVGAHQLRLELQGSVHHVGESVEKRLEDVRTVVDARLRGLLEDNAQRLDAMRLVVEEKLQGTLEERLGHAFRQVSERLEALHQGLGEMQSLATSVGSLEKVLSNVKTRGTWGEVQLGAILEQVLAPGQYEANVAVRPRTTERVEYAVKLPGPDDGDGEPVWLPIDAKFPQEDLQRLLEAEERGDVAAVEAASRALETRIRQEARRVRDRYICPPHTTDFAILFLPTESLYAEVLRRPGLIERLQREARISVAGPTTLAALLTSLQMGFRTLAIQKRSGEVWKLLGGVKAQFGQFSDLLEKVGRKLEEASATVGEASRKSETIQRRLGRVEDLTAGDADPVLAGPGDDRGDSPPDS